MVQNGDKHRGDSIDSRTTLLLYKLQCLKGIKTLHYDHRRAVIYTVEGTHDTPETMEKRYLDQETILLGHAHNVTHHPRVVDNIMMRQHYPFREPGRPGGILHIDHVVYINRHFTIPQLFIRNRSARPHDIIKTARSPLTPFISYTYNILERREPIRSYLLHIGAFDFRHHLPYNTRKTRSSVFLDMDQRCRIRLVEDIFQFMRLVIGIDRDQDGSDHPETELQVQPLWNIGGPDRNMITLLDTDRHETLGNLRTGVEKFTVRLPYAKLRTDKRITFRKRGRAPPQKFTHAHVSKLRHITSLSIDLIY